MPDPDPAGALEPTGGPGPAPGPAPAESRRARAAHRRGPSAFRWWMPLPSGIGIAIGVVATLVVSFLVVSTREPDALEEDDRPLVILSGRDGSLDGQRQQLVDAWNALHRDHPARIVELSPRADEQRAEMLARAQADHGEVDVYNLDVTWTAEFADAGYIRSIDESRVPTDGFLAGPLSTCRYDGRLWALPFNADVGLLYYRTDLLDSVGATAPRTWDELLAAAAQVRARTGDGVAGYVGQLADYEGLTVTALELIWGAGGEVVDDDGRVLPRDGDITAMRTGLDRLRTLAPELPALDEAGSLQAFREGKALFMRNWPVAYRSLGQRPQEGAALPFGVTALPPGSAALGGQNLAVSSRTTRPRAARALVEFLTSERSQQLLFQRGGLPATREVVYTDPQVTAVFPFAEELREALDTGGARRRPAVAHYGQFSETFRASVDGYLRGRDELPEDEVRDRLEAALEGRPPPGG